ncbi:SRPBCC family protein [Kitasatospora phosalacinea]|uniref:SRPBCC family protein n=1 Tax=Kitasatospora phosalacinea TaxID=2065 RepID=UPI0035D5D8B4
MTDYERSRTMPALPEPVLDEAAGPGRLDAWMPRDLHVRAEGPPAAAVRGDGGGDGGGTDGGGTDGPALLRMEWGTRDDGRHPGWLRVAGLDGGTSRVTVHLSCPGGDSAPPPETVERQLDEGLARLEEQVRLRVDSGG